MFKFSGLFASILRETEAFKSYLVQNLGTPISIHEVASLSMMNTVLQVRKIVCTMLFYKHRSYKCNSNIFEICLRLQKIPFCF